MGDRYRLNLAYLKEADQKVAEIEAQIAASFPGLIVSDLSLTQTMARLNGQIEAIQQKAQEWEQVGAPRMAEIQAILESESYATGPTQGTGRYR